MIKERKYMRSEFEKTYISGTACLIAYVNIFIKKS